MKHIKTTMKKELTTRELVHKADSHLSVIWGYVQLLQASAKNPKEVEWLKRMYKECENLKATFDEIK